MNREVARELFETVTVLDVAPSSEPAAEARRARLVEEAKHFRVTLQDSRSPAFVRLFDYLLARSVESRAPKEIEIALAVFGKEGAFDTSQNSIVRVHVHRLRRRLDAFYAGQAGARIYIPNGSYRIMLAEADEDSDGHGPPPAAKVAIRARSGVIVIAVLVFASLAFWGGLGLLRYAQPDLSRSDFWRPIATGKLAPLVVTGDVYLFADSDDEKQIGRIIMQPGIRSRKDLDGYLVDHPDDFYRLYDLDIHYMPASTSRAAWTILPLVARLRGEKALPGAVPASRLTDQALRMSNIIYVGQLGALGPLQDTLLHSAGFTAGADGNALVDRRSGKHYVAAPRSTDRNAAGGDRDYGYVASLPGASGNRIVIIASATGVALAQMVDLVSNKDQLDLIAQRAGKGRDFEALYEVRTTGRLTARPSLLIARPLRTTAGGGD